MTEPLPPNPPSLKGGGATDKACPRCKAAPGEPCVDRNDTPRTTHRARGEEPKASAAVRGTTDWRPLQEEARRLLPSEPEPFVIGAIQMIRYRGEPVTADAIRRSLRAEGKTKAQLSAVKKGCEKGAV